MARLDLTVHHCDWSSQPDLHIHCDDSWTTPLWGTPSAMQAALERREIFVTEDDRYYTFDDDKVTCKACLAKMKTQVA